MNPIDRRLREEVGPHINKIERQGYDVVYVPGPEPGAGLYRVTRPRHEHAPSYFNKQGLFDLASQETRSGFLGAMSAARRINPHFPREENAVMSTKKTATKKASAKKAAAKGPIPKPGEKKRAAAKQGGAEKPAKAERAPKQPKAPREAAGASVAGATPELLAHLATFQPDTIERMNGLRVVELVVAVGQSTVDAPVARKSLTVYPQRIAREMVRLGIFRQEDVEGVGLCYFPGPKFAPKKNGNGKQ